MFSSKNSSTPNPSHLSHAPVGELKENSFGSNFPTEYPQYGQAYFVDNICSSPLSMSEIYIMPFDISEHEFNDSIILSLLISLT